MPKANVKPDSNYVLTAMERDAIQSKARNFGRFLKIGSVIFFGHMALILFLKDAPW